MEHLMAIPPWATTTRRWRASGSGKRDIGSSSCEGVPIISGDAPFFFFFGGEVVAALLGWVLIDRPRSALYVVDLVRFRQMAAGVRETSSLNLRVMNTTFRPVGYLAQSLSTAFGRTQFAC